jgi:hypothetical protein
MARMDPNTVIAPARFMSGNSLTQLIPMKAETRCPPTKDHGCERGLAGVTNNRTAEAPMDAVIKVTL